MKNRCTFLWSFNDCQFNIFNSTTSLRNSSTAILPRADHVISPENQNLISKSPQNCLKLARAEEQYIQLSTLMLKQINQVLGKDLDLLYTSTDLRKDVLREQNKIEKLTCLCKFITVARIKITRRKLRKQFQHFINKLNKSINVNKKLLIKVGNPFSSEKENITNQIVNIHSASLKTQKNKSMSNGLVNSYFGGVQILLEIEYTLTHIGGLQFSFNKNKSILVDQSKKQDIHISKFTLENINKSLPLQSTFPKFDVEIDSEMVQNQSTNQNKFSPDLSISFSQI